MTALRNPWQSLRSLAEVLATQEPFLAADCDLILSAADLHEATGRLIAARLNWPELRDIYAAMPPITAIIEDDLHAIMLNDPAAKDILTPFLRFKGFHALQAYRLAHFLWMSGRRAAAEALQARTSVVLGVDIHPAARIGRGIMMDHATGIVIGETSAVGDNVLFWHGVTLGGTSSGNVDRHPKIGNGVILGANALLLGNITIGDNAKIGAGAIVVKDVAAGATVVMPKSA